MPSLLSGKNTGAQVRIASDGWGTERGDEEEHTTHQQTYLCLRPSGKLIMLVLCGSVDRPLNGGAQSGGKGLLKGCRENGSVWLGGWVRGVQLCVGVKQGVEGSVAEHKMHAANQRGVATWRHCGAAARRKRHLIPCCRPQLARGDERQGGHTKGVGGARRDGRRAVWSHSVPARPLSSAPEKQCIALGRGVVGTGACPTKWGVGTMGCLGLARQAARSGKRGGGEGGWDPRKPENCGAPHAGPPRVQAGRLPQPERRRHQGGGVVEQTQGGSVCMVWVGWGGGIGMQRWGDEGGGQNGAGARIG